MNKIIHYRNRCIGCSVCYELQPDIWRMSKKDGKVILLNADLKKGVFILPVSKWIARQTEETVKACPVKIIKLI